MVASILMERLEVIVYGRVQLVMYRDFAQRKARSLGLCGEVRNLPDGTVQVVAQGARTDLERFLKKLKKGPLFARVDSVVHSIGPAHHTLTSFDIIYD